MVQITTSAVVILLASIVAPVLAVPVAAEAVELQEREPIRFGGAIKLVNHLRHHPGARKAAHRAARGARFAANFIPPDNQRRELGEDSVDLSARAFPRLHMPKGGFRGLRGGLALGRFGGGHGPVVHRPFRRISAPSLQTRELTRAGFRAWLHNPDSRVHPIAREDASELDAREDTSELEAREPRFGSNHVRKFLHRMSRHRHGGAATAPPQDAPVDSRELSDDEIELMARDLSDEELDLMARDLSDEELELLAREPFMGFNHAKHWIGGRFHRHRQGAAAAAPAPADAAVAREYDDLMERELRDDLD